MNFYDQPANRWVLYRSAAYLGGQGATFGDAIVPHAAKAVGVNNVCIDVPVTNPIDPRADIVGDSFRMLADASLNHLFIGHRFEVIDNTEGFLREALRKLTVGGHLIFHQRPLEGAKHSYQLEEIVKLVGKAGRFRLKTKILRDGQFLLIFKKLEGKQGIEDVTHDSSPAKRACICRYGALGDMIMLTPLMKQLKKDGFHVTLNITPYAAPVIQNNPNYDNIVLQEREMIPNPELSQYWKEWQGDYEKYINLSESIEGKLLKVEGRPDFFTSKEFRIRTGAVNYYDQTMRLGGYPEVTGTRGELFFSNAEERDAQKFFAPYRNKFVLVWALNGSSHHKLHTSTEVMVEDWLVNHDDTVIILVGDGSAPPVNYPHTRLISMVGKWSVRQSLIASKYANCVIGPESMMLNAAACYDTPKVMFMSHSNPDALARYWTNAYCLEPDPAMAPCYPCFQLHFTKESCPLKKAVDQKTGEVLAMAPACSLNAIAPERVIGQLEEVYQKHFSNAKPLIVV